MEEKIEYWKIDESLLSHVTKVARLALSEEEIEKFTKELNEVLESFKKIDEANVDELQPMVHAVEVKNAWREDEEEKFQWEPFANTEHKEERYFKGPRIV